MREPTSCDNIDEVGITITLRQKQERLVIKRALEMLRSEDGWLNDNKEGIADKIERAFGQFERGEFLSAEASRADMEKRKAAWLREPQL